MDKRETFRDISELLFVIKELFKQQKEVSLLIDRNGLHRVSGIIKTINDEGKDQASIVFTDELKIDLKEIVGINGVFHTDYTEC